MRMTDMDIRCDRTIDTDGRKVIVDLEVTVDPESPAGRLFAAIDASMDRFSDTYRILAEERLSSGA